jgi:hypothetical protein
MNEGETNEIQKKVESKIVNNLADFTPILAKQRKRLTQNFSKISTDAPLAPPTATIASIKTVPQKDPS